MDFPMYTLTDLGAPDLGMLSGSLRSEATAVNWHQTGALVTAYSTSASGTVPDGPLYPPDGSARASWLYDELDGQPANVVSLADTNYGQPLGLDSHYPSTIVGWVSSDGRTPLPAIWERDEPPLAPGASQTPGGVGPASRHQQYSDRSWLALHPGQRATRSRDRSVCPPGSVRRGQSAIR
jgi:hypothetical protein